MLTVACICICASLRVCTQPTSASLPFAFSRYSTWESRRQWTPRHKIGLEGDAFTLWARCAGSSGHPVDRICSAESASAENAKRPPANLDELPWWRKVKRKDWPQELVEERRRQNNRARRLRARDNRRARAAQQTLLESNPELEESQHRDDGEEVKQARLRAAALQRERFEAAMRTGLDVVVECSFSSGTEVRPRELRSLAKQLETAAGLNRKHECPVRLSFASFDGALREVASGMHAAHWKAHMHAESAPQVFRGRSKVTVLSPDADEVLTQLEEDRVYIIGGIVDRTVLKNATRGFAAEHGFEVRKLPLEGNVEFFGEGRPHSKWFVLNIDDVLLALLEFRRTQDWKHACNVALPERKRRLGKH